MALLRFSHIWVAAWVVAVTAASVNAEAATPAKKKAKRAKVVAQQPAPPGPSYAQRADAMQAAMDMALRQGWDPIWVRETLGQARYIPAIAKAVTPPPVGVPKNWALYRSRFIEPIRIRAGVAFWRAHRDTLMRAEQQMGVPADIIVGIIGVESIYGQHTGNYRVLDALATLAFDFPTVHPRFEQRSTYFKGELEQYLALAQRDAFDPTTRLGSYAGAMGWPQFMPSSWANYAVDFDGDGKIDLLNSPVDVIGSVANYFKAFGWKTGMPTHYPVAFDPLRLNMAVLMAPDILPTFTVDRFQANGAVLAGDALQHPGPLALVELQNGDAPNSYVAGTENFYVITRYNWSSYYAMAVIELGQAVGAIVTMTDQ